MLIIVIILISCKTTTVIIPDTPDYIRPAEPEIPVLMWIEIDNHAALGEDDFDELQNFFDRYEGYVIKVNNILKLYESK